MSFESNESQYDEERNKVSGSGDDVDPLESIENELGCGNRGGNESRTYLDYLMGPTSQPMSQEAMGSGADGTESSSHRYGVSFDRASNFYQREKYPPSKRPNSNHDDEEEQAVELRSPRAMKKVRAAVYRNAAGSTYQLHTVYGKMRGSRGSVGAYRPVIDDNFSPNEPPEVEELDDDPETVPDTTTKELKKPIEKRKPTPNSGKRPAAWMQENNEEERLKNIVEAEILDANAINVTWDDVAGLKSVKKCIQEIVVWPMLRPDLFTGLRAPPKGLLLFGPPGTGKTTLGRCIASQAKATFYCISASSLTSKWVGENEKLVRALFQSARTHQPAVVFVDEVDALLSNRVEGEHDSTRRLKTQFLTELDGAKTSPDDRILVVGATNRPWELDDAARRRFTRRLFIPLPDSAGRIEMLENLLKGETHALTDQKTQLIADRTEGFSCDDLKKMCQEAALGPIRKLNDIALASSTELPPISLEDFENALCVVRPSVGKEQMAQYEEFDRRFGSAVGNAI